MTKFNISTILIAPLDWGLGHATRCIPIIKTLKNAGFNVIVAVCEKQKILLQQEFTNLKYIDLFGYDIQYSTKKWFFPFKIFFQVPKILRKINQENRWLDLIIEKEGINVVISDNRYGLHSTKVPCVFITHQLTIKAPFIWLENILQKINYRLINRFAACWIPDIESKNNIAGILSRPKKKPAIPSHYIGVLSRFENSAIIEQQFDVCILLSGPEPQRTVLENIFLKQLSLITNKKILFVRGLPQTIEKITAESVIIENHLSGNNLLQSILSSNIIIARSGYTTVMELLSLQKKSILIPTPGQTEQEYLADHLHHQKMCLAYNQDEVDIAKAIEEANNFDYKLSDDFSFQKEIILGLVKDLLK